MNNLFPKIHKEGYKFLAISIIVTFISFFISTILSLLLILITVWVYYFFRDPDRVIINNDKYFVSPADGLITQIVKIKGPTELGLENNSYTRISIFMNVFNCHVNRSPVSGTIEEIFYKPGKFINASFDKASEENERNYFKIKSNAGDEIVVIQIAGLIARRIITDVEKNQKILQGERLGIIRFGSRVDFYFKEDYKTLVKIGQNLSAGESLIAEK
tara:strand:+ start:628 stop:1275 length:648 start_codon:yes stop_codon:yes gene_type:complete